MRRCRWCQSASRQTAGEDRSLAVFFGAPHLGRRRLSGAWLRSGGRNAARERTRLPIRRDVRFRAVNRGSRAVQLAPHHPDRVPLRRLLFHAVHHLDTDDQRPARDTRIGRAAAGKRAAAARPHIVGGHGGLRLQQAAGARQRQRRYAVRLDPRRLSACNRRADHSAVVFRRSTAAELHGAAEVVPAVPAFRSRVDDAHLRDDQGHPAADVVSVADQAAGAVRALLADGRALVAHGLVSCVSDVHGRGRAVRRDPPVHSRAHRSGSTDQPGGQARRCSC